MDREKIVKAWEIFRDSNPYEICSGREFRAIRDPEYCMGQMIADTIALLKEQEAVWNVLHDLCELGYPHNFQREAPWVVDYLYELTEIIKKAFKAKEGR